MAGVRLAAVGETRPHLEAVLLKEPEEERGARAAGERTQTPMRAVGRSRRWAEGVLGWHKAKIGRAPDAYWG